MDHIVVDEDIIMLIERISYHYHFNIANRVLRPVILQIYLEKSTWDNIEAFTEKLEVSRCSGLKLDDLYRQIAACAHLVEAARNETESIKNKVNAVHDDSDKEYRDMTINNFSGNLQTFADLLNLLFVLLIDFDKRNSGENPPLYTQIPELDDVNHILTGE